MMEKVSKLVKLTVEASLFSLTLFGASALIANEEVKNNILLAGQASTLATGGICLYTLYTLRRITKYHEPISEN